MSLSYFWPRLLWAGDQAVHRQTHLPPTPRLAGQAPSTHTHFLYLPSNLGYHGLVSASLPPETPFELEPQDAGKILPTPTMVTVPVVLAASTVLVIIFPLRMMVGMMDPQNRWSTRTDILFNRYRQHPILTMFDFLQ